MDKYIRCVGRCNAGDGWSSDADKNRCKDVCEKQVTCLTVRLAVLTKVPTLVTLIGPKQVKSGSVLIHKDKIYQYFATFKNGKLAGYQIKNPNGKGTEFPFPLATFTIKNNKQYYIFDANRNYFQVKKPDVDSFIEISAKAIY